jgi:putative ABC transport system permease protein
MITFRLAFRNLLGAGLRTWLNVTVLSFSFVVMLSMKGIIDGWHTQAKKDMINWETGGGQFWEENYDPDDPFTFTDSHARVPDAWLPLISSGEMTPVLVTQGTLYPSGRMQSVIVRGIDPAQKLLYVPSDSLKHGDGLNAVIGSSMAQGTHVKKGDIVTLRWRDRNGAFDATEITIAAVFQTNVPTADVGQVWIPIEQLRRMMLMPGEATLFVCRNGSSPPAAVGGWKFMSQEKLLDDIEKIIKAKTTSSGIMWSILLMLALLAIFDTQILSIFRRQKEIGTYIALGMTRKQVVAIFTTEGALHALLAAILGAIYGIPLLVWLSVKGMAMPVKSSDYGLTMADKLYPEFSAGLIISTILIVFIATTIVSYLPSRKISGMRPTDALRGKIQ